MLTASLAPSACSVDGVVKHCTDRLEVTVLLVLPAA